MDGADRMTTPFGAFLRSVGDELAGAIAPTQPIAAAVDRSTWRRLFEPVTPVPGESLRGLVATACRANHLPNSFGLLQHLGLVHRNRVIVSEDSNIDPAELAWAIRVEEAEVTARRYPMLGRRHVSFHGLHVDVRQIETAVRRFSPMAFRADADDRHHHRAAWELRDVPFCFDHWDMLQETCWCESRGVVQRWSRTATWVDECDACGDPLAWLEPIPVPEDMRPALRLLQDIVLPTQHASGALPRGVRGADRGTLFQLVLRLAHAIDPNAVDAGIDEPERRLRGLHLACAALSAWPGGLQDVELAEGVTDNTRNWLKASWRRLGQEAKGRAAGGTATKTQKKPGKPGRPPAQGPVGIRRATEIARLSPETLHAAWEHRLVTRHERRNGDRSVAAFHPDELLALGAAWRERRDAVDVAAETGLPVYGVEQLAAIGGLVADAVALPGTGPHFTPENVAHFLAKLEGGGVPLLDPVPLERVMRRVGGRLKPWGPALALLLEDELDYEVGDGRRLADRIRISERNAEEITALEFERTDPPAFGYSETIVQGEALDVLNATINQTGLLSALSSRGRNPKFYSIADVLRLATEIVTLREIGAVLSLDPPAAALHELRRRGMADSGAVPAVWPRSVLLSLV